MREKFEYSNSMWSIYITYSICVLYIVQTEKGHCKRWVHSFCLRILLYCRRICAKLYFKVSPATLRKWLTRPIVNNALFASQAIGAAFHEYFCWAGTFVGCEFIGGVFFIWPIKCFLSNCNIFQCDITFN